MRVLVGCEYSGVVRDAFTARGHYAVSCDLLPSESNSVRHIRGNVLNVLNRKWDLGIFFPPCTYLTYAGAGSWNDEGRQEKRKAAMEFFMALWNAPIPKIAIENPRGYPCEAFRKPHQTINPFDFDEPHRKRICLWLKNLPPLFSTIGREVRPRKTYIKSNGRKYNCYFHQGKNGHQRSMFFKGIAAAMADQWGGQGKINNVYGRAGNSGAESLVGTRPG